MIFELWHRSDLEFLDTLQSSTSWVHWKVSIMSIPKGLINNISALVQLMAWHRLGDTPLSEPMSVRLLTHICITRFQCVKNAGHNGPHYDKLFSCGHFPSARPRLPSPCRINHGNRSDGALEKAIVSLMMSSVQALVSVTIAPRALWYVKKVTASFVFVQWKWRTHLK